MPGFTNYVVSTPDEAEEPVTRKYYIENIDYSDVQKVSVVIGEEAELEEVSKIIKENQEKEPEETPKTQS